MPRFATKPLHHDLLHRILLELFAVVARPDVGLLASQLGGKASKILGAPQTKPIPEEVCPVQIIGTMRLARAVDNFFQETEQVAFCKVNVIPGDDFTDDPLLRGRNFSCLDTPLTRLGSPNFTKRPINAPRIGGVFCSNDKHHPATDQIGGAASMLFDAAALLLGADSLAALAARGCADGLTLGLCLWRARRLRAHWAAEWP